MLCKKSKHRKSFKWIVKDVCVLTMKLGAGIEQRLCVKIKPVSSCVTLSSALNRVRATHLVWLMLSFLTKRIEKYCLYETEKGDVLKLPNHNKSVLQPPALG